MSDAGASGPSVEQPDGTKPFELAFEGLREPGPEEIWTIHVGRMPQFVDAQEEDDE